jgi:hypothetical protein
MTIKDVILNNNWKATTVKKSTSLNAMLSSGIIATTGEEVTDLLGAINEQNVQSVIKTALVDYQWAEGNLGDASATNATAISPDFTEVDVKTFYVNQWWNVKAIQSDLLKSTTPKATINEFIGRFWAETYNKIIGATITGMADIAEIIQGDGLATFTSNLVIDTMLLKGDMGMKGLETMQMNAKTFVACKKKEPTMFTQTFGNSIMQVVGGVETIVRGEPTGWVYDGYVKVVIDDVMPDGKIAFINKGAFAWGEKENIENPLMYNNDPKAGNGAGSEDFGTKKLFILHPRGFKFIGVLATGYASKSGLTLAELQTGGLYDLAVDVKLSPITILWISIA